VEEIFASFDKGETSEGNKQSDECQDTKIAYENEIPRPGMTFSSEDQVFDYYANYSRSMGFGMGKISSKKGDDGKKYFTLACSRATKYTSKNLLKPNPITKIGCKARLNACMHVFRWNNYNYKCGS
jgi:hypothetical protein